MLIINCKTRTQKLQDDLAERYFADVRRTKQLTEEELRQLLTEVKKGDPETSANARRKIITCTQRFVASIAKHMTDGDNFNDLISEGNIGLDKAIDKFDLNFTQRFTTYAAFWIKKYMTDYVVNGEKLIVTKNANKVYAYVESVRNKYFLKNGRYPRPEEIQKILKKRGITLSNTDDLITLSFLSIDDIGSDGTDDEHKPKVASEYHSITASNNVEEEIQHSFLKSVIQKGLECLTPSERYVVTHYHGIDCVPTPIPVIANELNLETRGVLRRYKNALKKLRQIIKF